MNKKEKEPLTAGTGNDSNDNISTNYDNTDSSRSQEDSPKYLLVDKLTEAQAKVKGRHCTYVVYADSAGPKDVWVEELKKTGLAFVVSPYHDKDVNPDGTPKKPHWHVIISWGNTTTFRNAVNIADTIFHCPLPDMLRGGPKGMYRYLTHQDDPDKYQYKEKPTAYNGWEVPLDSVEVARIKEEIRRVVLLEDCQEYGELMCECAMMGPEYLEVCQNNTVFFDKLCSSYRHSPVRNLERFLRQLQSSKDEKDKREAIVIENQIAVMKAVAPLRRKEDER